MSEATIWSRRIADELWSGPVSPLTFTLLAPQMEAHLVRARLAIAGLDIGTATAIARHRGHVFVNATLVADVMAELPARLVGPGLLGLLPPGLSTRVHHVQRSLVSPRVWWIGLRVVLGERAWLPWSRARRFEIVSAELRRTLEAAPAPATLDDAGLILALDDACAELGRFLDTVSWAMIYAYLFFHLLEELVRRWAPAEFGQVADLTSGVPGVLTFEVHEELRRCARAWRAARASRSDCDPDGRDPSVAAAAVQADVELRRQLDAVLRRHGHRLVERDLAAPSWRERPDLLLQTLVAVEPTLEVPGRPPTGRGGDQARLRGRRALAAVLTACGPGPGGACRRLGLRTCVAGARRYTAIRENMRYFAELLLFRLRDLALEAGARLLARGTLAAVSDVFLLEADELRAALRGAAGGAPDRRWGELLGERRTEMEFARQQPPPEVLEGTPGRPVAEASAQDTGSIAGSGADETRLHGQPGAPGRATGRALVARGFADLGRLRAGDVLVASSTEPSWTTFLELCAGLVLEAGGPLSHGAIVARELGIPAAVSVRGATRTVPDGTTVEVDGTSGWVDLLSRAAARDRSC